MRGLAAGGGSDVEAADGWGEAEEWQWNGGIPCQGRCADR